MWTSVARLVAGKDANRCREKWVNILDPTVVRAPFSAREDTLLRLLVARDGPGNWAEKATWFPGRTDFSLMAHWKRRDVTAADEVKAHAAAAHLRRRVLMPKLDRQDTAVSALQTSDFVPVLRARGTARTPAGAGADTGAGKKRKGGAGGNGTDGVVAQGQGVAGAPPPHPSPAGKKRRS
jgi:hypothetical protein